MCRVMNISRSSFYNDCHKEIRRESKRKLLLHIHRIFQESRKNYGAPRVYQQLKSDGISCGRNRVAKYMREAGMIARKRRVYKKPVSKQRIKPKANNLLNRQFNVTKKDRVWGCDVSYFWTQRGWVHLAVVMDLYSRKIIGWSMGDRLDKYLTQNALKMALDHRKPEQKLMHHSDQGAEYTNKMYQELLASKSMKVSMSRKANCYDNAVVESFFKTIKSELSKNKKFETLQQARTAIFDYIEVFYNRKRMHSTLGYMSPEQYERLNPVN